MKQQTVLRGSVWLIASALTAKVLGAVFRIPLTALLGGEGMGYFSCAYGLFLPVFALSVTGINTAVAALTAQYYGQNQPGTARRTVQLALRMFLSFGLAGCLLLYGTADWMCQRLLQNPPASAAVKLFAPAVCFCCINAVLRGEAEGRCRMQPTAVSQVTEGIGRVLFGLMLAYMTMTGVLPCIAEGVRASAAAAAIFGVSLSTAVGTLTLLCIRERKRTPYPALPHLSDREIRLALIRLVLPVAAASLVTNMTALIDMATGIRLLTPLLGSQQEANFQFGAYAGLAVTVCNLIPAVTNMLGKGVMPAFAAAYSRQDIISAEQNAVQSVERTAFLAVPAGLGLSVLSVPVLSLLFAGQTEEIAAVSAPLSVLAASVILTALCYPLFSMMQAAGYAGETVTVMLSASGIKLLLNFLLISRMGLSGAAFSTAISSGLLLLLTGTVFRRRTGLRIQWLIVLLKPVVAGIGCAAAAERLYRFVSSAMSLPAALLCAVFAGGTVYFLLYFLLSAIKKRNLRIYHTASPKAEI